MTNGSYILVRGDTHLPFALPRLGTPCAALLAPRTSAGRARTPRNAGDMESGLMGAMDAAPTVEHEDDHDDDAAEP